MRPGVVKLSWIKTDDCTVIKLKLPLQLKHWLKEKARKNMRPLNSQIVMELLEAQKKDAGKFPQNITSS